jgi:hypothetical protein
MELRITINYGRKNFADISGNYFCYLQDDIQDKFPYLVRNRRFKSISSDVSEKFTECFIRKCFYCEQPINRLFRFNLFVLTQ